MTTTVTTVEIDHPDAICEPPIYAGTLRGAVQLEPGRYFAHDQYGRSIVIEIGPDTVAVRCAWDSGSMTGCQPVCDARPASEVLTSARHDHRALYCTEHTRTALARFWDQGAIVVTNV